MGRASKYKQNMSGVGCGGVDRTKNRIGGRVAFTFHGDLSVPRFDSFHPNHERHDLGVVGVEESSAVGRAVACTFVDDAEPDSARVTSSAKRSRSSKAIRSSAALSRAADASSSGIEPAEPYAHEPATTAATVSPCATMRTRSQLLNECDWPLRIFVMAMTSAAVVAAAPARLHQSACSRKTE
jgi:hypothetical protein